MEIDMDARLAEMPIMAERDDSIDADVFNAWCRARKKLGSYVRLSDLGLKQMEMIVSDKYWVCVDSNNNDCPVLAWVDIEEKGRDSLHLPIKCKLNYYHFAASALRAKVLVKTKELLEQMIENDQ
ncbi:MAG: hypothetical protein OEX17_05240 [Rhodospirillaceae bacterium]|nr:hypothetical protein [Rhodospirillaceae bacterium]